MAFIRIRMIKGRQYRYREERWREGGKVRSRSICLGPVDGEEGGFLRRLVGRSDGVDWDAIARQELERIKTEDAHHAALHARLYLDYGLKLGPSTPIPEEKVVPTVDLSAPDAAPEQSEVGQENAPPDSEAEAQ